MKKVLVTVSLLVAAAACEPEVRTIEPGRGPSSGALAVTRDDRHVLVAAEDHDQLLVVDRATRAVLARIPVGDGPAHVIVLEDGRAAVTNRYGNSLTVVDVARRLAIKTIAVGVEPMGLVSLGRGKVAVVLAGDAAVAVVDVAAGEVVQQYGLAESDPRAVALLPDGSLYVAHMATGAFTRLDLSSGMGRRVDITTRNAFGPRLTAEHLRSLTVDDKRGTVLVAHSQANEDPVRAPIGGFEHDIVDPGMGCGYSGCPTELGAVVPGITEVDTETDTPLIPQPAAPESNGDSDLMLPPVPPPECDDCVMPGFGTPNPPSVLNPFEQRFAGVQISNPTAIALFDGGRGQLVVNMGSKNALLLRRALKGAPTDVLASVALGNGAQSVALTHDGAFAYIWNQFDLVLTEIALPLVPDLEAGSRFASQEGAVGMVETLGVVPELPGATIALGIEDALDRDASIGRKMFHDATDSRISASGTMSCASCHPDGRADGRTWQFVFGPRNTPQLGGDILDTAPFHWPGDVPTVADLNGMTVLPFMGGTGLDPASFELVAAFIGTIRAAPTAFTSTGAMTAQEMRGSELFFSDATGCATCHAGAHFTDNHSHDVGTQAGPSDITTFQTPVLHGLNRSAPYLHDGSQTTLEDLVATVVRTDRMGYGSHLSDEDAAALTAYLKTL